MPLPVAAVGAGAPELNARLSALQAFNPTLGSLTSSLAVANQTLAGIQAAIGFGISPPSMSAQLAEVSAQIASLTVIINKILSFMNLTGAAGVCLFDFEGTANQFGSQFTSALSGGLPDGSPSSSYAYARVLMTTVGASGTAIRTVLSGP